jgi:hypothetical protein
MDRNQAIMSGYRRSKGKTRGKKQRREKEEKQNTITETTTNIDLRRRVQVDVKPDWMKNIRVVRGLTDVDECDIDSHQPPKSKRTYLGYKIVSQAMTGFDGFKYQEKGRYKHERLMHLCTAGFHFSPESIAMFALCYVS